MPTDDLEFIEEWHLSALFEMLVRPSHYNRRVFESLTFLPGGGQQWERRLQIRLPRVPTSSAQVSGGRSTSTARLVAHTPTAFIVSLGMFERKRFPDLRVEDAAGRGLVLLTRYEHGYCLANGMLRQFLSNDEWGMVNATEDGRATLDSLFPRLASMLTNVVATRDPKREDVLSDLDRLLRLVEAPEARLELARTLMTHAYDQMQTQVQYLCWVPADAGSLVNLSVSYTIADSPNLSGYGESFNTPDGSVALADRLHLRRVHAKWRDFRMRRYASVGLRPLYYEMRAPAHDHCASYYFAASPPPNSQITYLDWGLGRSFEKRSHELDSAQYSCHVHNGADASERSLIVGAKIALFVRADPADHGSLAALALFGALLTFLAQKGTFVTLVAGAVQWMLLVPAATVVLIGLHRQHHYAPVMRPLRITLWVYVALSVIFAAAAIFDTVPGDDWNGRVDALDDFASGAFGLASIALLVMLAASGPYYNRATRRELHRVFGRSRIYPGCWSRFQRLVRFWWFWPDAAEKKRRTEHDYPDDGRHHYETARMYESVCRRYADRAVLLSVALLCAVVIVAVESSWGEGRSQAELVQRTACGQGHGSNPALSSVRCP